MRRVPTVVGLVTALVVLPGVVPLSEAQQIEPRAYSNIPIGLNFLAAVYAYAEGDIEFDASGPIQDASLKMHTTGLAYVRSFGLLGRSGSVGVVLPYAWMSGRATFRGEEREREVSGLGDPKLRLAVNLHGAPAMTREEFADYRQDLIVGVSLLVSAPLGQYDDDKLLNVGANRWSFKPEIGVSKAWGPVTLELAFGVTFFTTNDDFLVNRTLEREPMYSLQGHLIYNLPWGIWASLNAVGYRGGRVSVDGVRSDTFQENVRVGVTLSFPVTRHSSVKINGSTGAYARFGGSFTAAGIAWQLVWGGGS
ncbi:MAG TPA: transporter [Methylomirabilota bacterium]|nr:transporter [Methylomirabilota bacterium]